MARSRKVSFKVEDMTHLYDVNETQTFWRKLYCIRRWRILQWQI